MAGHKKGGPTADFNTTAEYSIAPACIQELGPALLMAGATPHAVGSLAAIAGAIPGATQADLSSLKAAEKKLDAHHVEPVCRKQLHDTLKRN